MGVAYTKLDGSNIRDAAAFRDNLGFQEAVQDAVGAMLVEGSGVTITYDDVTGTVVVASTTGTPGADGEDGASAYEIAVENGFVGTEAEWLDSLVGEQGPQGIQGVQGPQGAQGPQGNPGTPGADGADGADGDSAYDVAVANGFVGTEVEWLDSLVGEQGPQGPQGEQGPQGLQGVQGPQGNPGTPGADGADGADGSDGASAYEIAVANGFVGTEAEWLDSLVGEQGPQGIQGIQGVQGPQGNPGSDGSDGADGDSAYDIAVANGFVGTEAEWLDSLIGPEGPEGPQGEQGPQGVPGNDGADGDDGAPGPNTVTTSTTTNINGVLTGNGTVVGTRALAEGDLDANAVTNAKLNDMAVNTIKGRVSSGTGDPEDLTTSQVKTMLGVDKTGFNIKVVNPADRTGLVIGRLAWNAAFTVLNDVAVDTGSLTLTIKNNGNSMKSTTINVTTTPTDITLDQNLSYTAENDITIDISSTTGSPTELVGYLRGTR